MGSDAHRRFFAMLHKDNIIAGKALTPKQRNGLRDDDVQFGEPRKGRPAVAAWLCLRYSKTVQYQECMHYVLLVATRGDLCPVQALRHQFARRQRQVRRRTLISRC